MLFAMILSGCGQIVVSRNVISEEQFWIGLEENGYTKEHDMSKEFAESNGFDKSEMIVKCAYYYDEPTEYVYIETKSNSRALQVFNVLVEEYEKMCNSNSSVSSGAFKSWSGSSKSDDIFITVQKYENIIIVGGDTYANKDAVKEIVDQLFTMDYTGKELQYEEKSEEELDEEPDDTENSEFENDNETTNDASGESSGKHIVYVSDIPVTLPEVEGWKFDDSYDNILPVTVNEDYDVIYSDSYIEVDDANNVVNTLMEEYDFDKKNINKIALNDVESYIGYSVENGYTNIITYQDIGFDTYLEIEILYFGECETINDVLDTVSMFALTIN